MADNEELIRLVNEYTAVRVGVDRSGASPRLRISSDRTGDQVVLDATALEAIASLDHERIGLLVGVFSETGDAGDLVERLAEDRRAPGSPDE
ncbi:hypothetical protein [Nocardioides soli]|uniref:Uncharacterized protein n=1 Tax=Nocardioides soli TaxID=1036020 RepID=A0A7W4Z3R0_9ACTN|nr:hypothetical protein [Nocardioides soli]MBB3045363.1 hypothetical protein [Nocardioides soli]